MNRIIFIMYFLLCGCQTTQATLKVPQELTSVFTPDSMRLRAVYVNEDNIIFEQYLKLKVNTFDGNNYFSLEIPKYAKEILMISVEGQRE